MKPLTARTGAVFKMLGGDGIIPGVLCMKRELCRNIRKSD